MPRETMIKGDWWKEVKKQANPVIINWTASPIEVTVDFDKDLHKKLSNDPLLLQKLSDAGSEKYKEFIASATKQVKDTEVDLSKMAKKFMTTKDLDAFQKEWDEAQSDFIKELRVQAMVAETEIEKAMLNAFARYQKTKKEYKGYKIRSGVKLAVKFSALGFAIGKLIGTSGADLTAWRSLVRDSIKSVTEITKLCMSAETFRKATDKQLKVVLSWHAKLGDGKGATTSEVGLGLLKVVIGTDCEMTLDAVGANVKQFQNKIKGVELSAHKVSKKLQIALNRMDSVKKEVPQDLQSQLDDLQKDIRTLITRIGDLMGEVGDGITWSKNVNELVVDLKKAKSVTHAGKVVKGLETLADVAASTAGWVSFGKEGTGLATKIGAQTVTVGKNIDRWQDEVKKMSKS